MALSGVRSSWLMLARNSLFSRLFSRIWALATSSSCFCRAISCSWRWAEECSEALSRLIAAWLAMTRTMACSRSVKGLTRLRPRVNAPIARLGDSSGITSTLRGALGEGRLLNRGS